MTAEIVELDVQTRLPVPSDKLLRKALEANVSNVVIIGYDPDGDLYFSASDAECGSILWLIEMAKKTLIDSATA